MLKRFGLAGILFAVSAVAPLTAAAQGRDSSHGQSQWTAQAQHNVQVRDTRDAGYNSGQDFRGGSDDRGSQFRFRKEPVRRPIHYRGFDRDDARR
jgi:hypothetical protein